MHLKQSKALYLWLVLVLAVIALGDHLSPGSKVVTITQTPPATIVAIQHKPLITKPQNVYQNTYETSHRTPAAP